MAVYRDFDQEALDYQYNTRAEVPDFQDFFDRWAAASQKVRAEGNGMIDLSYGPGPRERIDIFPAGADDPVVLYIHGGYWRAFDKSYFSFLAPIFCDAGMAMAAISYPLAPAATMDEIVDAVRRAAAWLVREGENHGLNTDRLVALGHSAGGHLVAELLSTDWARYDAPDDVLKGGFAVSGLYDLEPIRLSFLNEDVRLDAGQVLRNSPIHHVPPGAPPLVMTAGGKESGEFHRQQAEYAAAWRAAGNVAEIVDAPDLHHFDILDRFADPASTQFRALEKLARGDSL